MKKKSKKKQTWQSLANEAAIQMRRSAEQIEATTRGTPAGAQSAWKMRPVKRRDV